MDGDPEFGDDISGAALPAEAVRAARAEEVTFMESRGGWTRVAYEEAVRCGDRKTRWVGVNNGDAASPMSVHARLLRALQGSVLIHSARRPSA